MPFNFNKIKNGLIVSCQSEGDDPFNYPESVTLFAKAAMMGGAVGIRSQGIEKTKMIVEQIPLPVIGLMKSKFEDGSVKITGSFTEIEQLIFTGCHLIAIDGTFRKRDGWTGPEFIREAKNRYDITVMADISTLEDGLACAEFADCLSTTLSGYTPETKNLPKDKPNFILVEELIKKVNIPVIAEGKINTPESAKQMINLGAWSVVVGTAITRPRIITSWFVEAINEKN